MTARRIIRTYLGIAASTTLAQSLIWGINTLFLLSVGLDIFQVMLVNAAYTVAQVFFEVPTGVIADTLGRRVSYLLAVGIIFVSTLLYMWFGLAGLGVVPVRRRLGAPRARLHLLHGRRGRLDGRRPALGGLSRQARAHLRPLRHGRSASSCSSARRPAAFSGRSTSWIPYAARAAVLVPAFLLGCS